MAREDISLDLSLTKLVEKGRKEREGEGRRVEREALPYLYIFPTIGLSVSDRARDKVLPRSESFKLRLKTRSFDKLQEVGFFLLLDLILV